MESWSSGRCKATRYEDNNARVYRTIPLSLPSDWDPHLNYSFRSHEGPVLEALPTKEGLMVGLVLFKPSYAPLRDLNTVEEADRILRKLFPDLR